MRRGGFEPPSLLLLWPHEIDDGHLLIPLSQTREEAEAPSDQTARALYRTTPQELSRSTRL